MSSTFSFAITGGILIGLAATIMHLFLGRVTGISGIYGSSLSRDPEERGWRMAFVLGLLLGGALMFGIDESLFSSPAAASMPLIAVAGVLVGFGARYGSGCTSGHGVCGVSRMSQRSLAATLSFIATGALSVAFLG